MVFRVKKYKSVRD